jgi:hypothetical protein
MGLPGGTVSNRQSPPLGYVTLSGNPQCRPLRSFVDAGRPTARIAFEARNRANCFQSLRPPSENMAHGRVKPAIPTMALASFAHLIQMASRSDQEPRGQGFGSAGHSMPTKLRAAANAGFEGVEVCNERCDSVNRNSRLTSSLHRYSIPVWNPTLTPLTPPIPGTNFGQQRERLEKSVKNSDW